MIFWTYLCCLLAYRILLTVGEVSWAVISLLRVKLKHETVYTPSIKCKKKMSLKMNKFMK